MNTYIIFLIIIIFSILIYYLFFLENYLFIKSSFLSQNKFITIKNDLEKIDVFEENNQKKYCFLDFKKFKNIYKIIYQDLFLKKYIKENFQKDLTYPSKPIEYRIYKNNNESMGWHQDIQYLDQPYLECIFILDNSCHNRFYYLKNVFIHSYLQKENDLILLKPIDLIHNIDPIKNYSKKILKFIIDL